MHASYRRYHEPIKHRRGASAVLLAPQVVVANPDAFGAVAVRCYGHFRPKLGHSPLYLHALLDGLPGKLTLKSAAVGTSAM